MEDPGFNPVPDANPQAGHTQRYGPNRKEGKRAVEKRAVEMNVLRKPKDELGCIMGALRAMERTGWIWLASYAKGSKHMMDRLSQRQVQEQPEEALTVLRRMAVEVARLDVQADLEDLRRDLPCLQQEPAT